VPKRPEIKKVMVIGSGPIVIGQAAEFDYAGTQACKALREEGIEVVLVNSNPATIMTDLEIADIVYIEPLKVEFLSNIIEKERPDGLLPTLGGQTGLNLAVELAKSGVLDKYKVKLLGTPLKTIQQAEDREYFKKLMQDIREPIPESVIVLNLAQAKDFAKKIGFPLIIRPAYTLGGTGGGIAHNEEELGEIISRGLKMSMIRQVLVEQCVLGWKEIEYEIMRDGADNCITVCTMENIDPMGIHTGDSIVVAPVQTLSDKECQMFRSASFKIIRALGIEGGCNIQFAQDPQSFKYFVIEVNPRVSRSSALASKATGFPIARVAAKIATGLNLDEIRNQVTGETWAAFEPAIDYVVVKIPRWPFDKFSFANRKLGSQMKATGEVMAIDRTFEASLMKAIRSLEIGLYGPKIKGIELWSEMTLETNLEHPTDERLFALFEAFRRGMGVGEVYQITYVDHWFLNKIKGLVEMEKEIKKNNLLTLKPSLLEKTKKKGFSDRYLGELLGVKEDEVRQLRRREDIKPVYKKVDTCAAEFEAETPYYYSSYESEDEAEPTSKKKAIVVGGGPIRIGQGIEFDYCSVHSVWALSDLGYESIIINNNPETVSTDFDTSDKLYFEPLTLEDVLNVIRREEPEGVVLQLGGQTPLNLAEGLAKEGVNILGTSQEGIDIAEDRKRLEKLLRELNIPKPEGRAATSLDEAQEIAGSIGYPVLVRPSYVLGGRAMEIVYGEDEIRRYMKLAVDVSSEHPVLVDKYLLGKEVEVDAISDSLDVLIPGIMEHIERAGVHSGDSMAVCPARTLREGVVEQIITFTSRIARALPIKGLVNIQYVVVEEKVYLLEVNPRASRTIPYLSKVEGIPLVKTATKVMLGKSLKELGFKGGLHHQPAYIGVKAPVFSFAKLTEVDINLGPEMKSTGEIMGIDYNFSQALYKAMVASGLGIGRRGSLIATIADLDKEEAFPLIKEFARRGFKIYATSGTAKFLKERKIKAIKVNKLHEGSPHLIDLIASGKVDFLLNTLSSDKIPEKEGAKIRRATVEHNIPCLTSLDTAKALLYAFTSPVKKEEIKCRPMNEYISRIY